jgi:hypothetical protein
MKPWRTLTLAAVIAICAAAGAGLAQTPVDAKPAAIWYTEEFIVSSKIVGRDFLIQVAGPIRPQAGKAPVIYLLDGNGLFGEVADMVLSDGYFGDFSAAYVVGLSVARRRPMALVTQPRSPSCSST